jgi:ubiquinone/menaquinone biosynthesis C-methylase UbiE
VGVDWKQRAIEQWTVDPCGPDATTTTELLRRRRDYAPWMASALDYAGSRDLDVLDVGCGQGIDLCEYARAGARVTGIDLTPRHVELARRHLADLGLDGTVVLGDAEQLPFADNQFDRVSSNGVLHHTPSMQAALSEIYRVLRPDGRATIIVYNRNSWHFWAHQVLVRGILKGRLFRKPSLVSLLYAVERGSGRPLVNLYSQYQVRQMLVDAGFSHAETAVSPFRKTESRLGELLGARDHGWYVIGRAVK